MSNVAINIAAEFTGKKAFKQAETSTDKLGKSVKKLAGALGLAFGARAIANYGKNAVKAFAEDEKAAKALTLTLDNLGMAFANPEVTNFIASLEKQFGVLDDQLRPSYQKLLTATGDYKKSQDLLRTSLDLAAMSGSDVVSVSNDIARAYAGNTRGLIKYGLGLDKAQIAAMSFEEILQQIAVVSSGQAQSAADSYAGSLDRLNVAAANAAETIGKGLIDAISTLAGGDGLPKTIGLIENMSEGLSRGLVLTARLIRNFGILAAGNPLESIKDLRTATQKDQMEDRRSTATYGGIYARNYQAQVKPDKTAKETLKINKENLKLAKARATFDLQKIQVEAALKGKISEEDRIRLKLMKAIEDENLAGIDKYQKALTDAQAKTVELQKALASVNETKASDPFSNWAEYVKTAIDLTNSVAQASLQAGLDAGAKLSEALSGARYAAQGAAAAEAAANAAAIAGAYGSASATAIKAAADQAAAFKAGQDALLAESQVAAQALKTQGAANAAAIAGVYNQATAAAAEAQSAQTAALKTTTDFLTAQGNAASSALKALSDEQLNSLKQRLAAEAAAYKELMEATAAAAEAALLTGANQYTTGNLAKVASEAAAAAAAAAAASSAAGVASGSTSGTTNIAVTISGDPFTDPNAVAEKVVEIIRQAGNRGTVDVMGFE